jgi:hypothetical protein
VSPFDYAHNAVADLDRAKKALALAWHCHGVGIDPTVLDAKGRRATERAAGVRRSSDETWGKVVAMVDRWRAEDALLEGPLGEILERFGDR